MRKIMGEDRNGLRNMLAGATAAMMLLGLAGCAPQFAGTPLSDTRGTTAPAASDDTSNTDDESDSNTEDTDGANSTHGETAGTAEDSAISKVAIARLEDTVAMKKGDGYLTLRGAHELRDGISDMNEMPFGAGQYEFTVYCVGPATVSFDFAIGDAKGEAVAGCGDGSKVNNVGEASVVLDVTSADSYSLSATPTSDADAETTKNIDTTLPPAYIAYRIDKVA